MPNKKLFVSLALLALTLGFVSAKDLGKVAWAAVYDRPNPDPLQADFDSPAGLVLDAAGNVHVTGTTYGTNGHSDITTLKYDTNGHLLWANHYSGSGPANNFGVALALGSNGDVYVTGTVSDVTNHDDIALLKYDPDGHLLWAVQYDGPTHAFEAPTALRVDPADHVYVTGVGHGTNGTLDIVTLKYNSLGNRLWVSLYDSPSGHTDRGNDLAVDNVGNVYVAGATETCEFTNNPSPGACYYDGILLKYDPDGRLLWLDRYGGPPNPDDSFDALTLDPSGAPVVTGWTRVAEPMTFEIVTVKYNSSGIRLWVATRPNTGPDLGGGKAVIADSAGNIFVTGGDFQTLKYSPVGDLLWASTRGGYGRDLALDGAGHVVVAGLVQLRHDILDMVLVEYDADGQIVGVARFGGKPGSHESPVALALDAAGDVIVAASQYRNNPSTSDILTLKFTATQPPRAPLVLLHASRPFTSEATGHLNDPGLFTLSRSGQTTTPLTVRYSVSGTASNGLDYVRLSGTAIIPAGRATTSILIQPIDDQEKEGVETVRLELIGDPAYQLRPYHRATVFILDNDLKRPRPIGRK